MGDKDTLQPLRMNGTYEDGLKSVRTNSALMTRGICGERRHPSLWSCTHTRAQAAEKLKEEVHGDAGARSLGAAPGQQRGQHTSVNTREIPPCLAEDP